MGRRLFEGDSQASVLESVRSFDPGSLEFPGVTEETARILRKGLAPNPEDRFRDVGSFLAALAVHGPERATPAQLTDFWDALFIDSEEEATSPALALERGVASPLVREPVGYGFRGTRGKVIAAAMVALAVGGIYLLVERGSLFLLSGHLSLPVRRIL